VLLHEVVQANRPFGQSPAAVTATQYLTHIASPAAAPAIPALQAFLARPDRATHHWGDFDTITWDQHCQHVARNALHTIPSH
jgi:hypothetical protein